jgi:pyruvate carboxylase subunit B
MPRRRIAVMNTSFRDGFQSVYGAWVFTADFLPAVEAARDAGFTHFEAGGGARYQSLYLYCNEDAFEMMDAFRATAGPDANLQTLTERRHFVRAQAEFRNARRAVIATSATMSTTRALTTKTNCGPSKEFCLAGGSCADTA